MRTFLLTFAGIVVVGLLAVVSVAYSGSFNVATGWKDPAPLEWLLETARDESIKTRATGIQPPELTNVKDIENGFRSYRHMCSMCHTPPGAKDSPVTKGMNPTPPDLSESAEELSAAELFWATKNGIRMTGMPAWGVTHGDKELWDIIAFVKTLPTMDGKAYQALDKRTPAGHAHGPDSDHGDSHGHDDAGHGGIDDQDHGMAADKKSTAAKKHSHDDGHTH